MRQKKVESNQAVTKGRVVVLGKPASERIDTGCSIYEELLIKAATGMNDNYEERRAVAKLKEMDPGIRELKMRTLIAEQYEDENWEAKIKAYEESKNGLYEKFGLKEPSDEERLEAVRNSDNLTESQKLALINKFARKISNLETAALVQLKLRATDDNKLDLRKFTYDEKRIIDKLLPGNAPLEERATQTELQRLKFELIEKFKSDGHGGRFVFPSASALYRTEDCNIESLRNAVRERKEAEVILEFMGRKTNKVNFRYDLTFTKGKNSINEDDYLSAEIEYAEGKTATFDAVFDGVGESRNAHLASAMAVEVFKLAMLLEPPRNNKDMEIIMSMADLAIFQNKDREVGLCTSSTTAVAALIKENKAYVAHVGDSKWMLFRNNKRHYYSIDHSMGEDCRKKGIEFLPEFAGAITSALGTGFSHIDSDDFFVKKGDIFILCTDGISDVVLVAEMEKVLAEYPIEVAEEIIFNMALTRSKGAQEYPTILDVMVWGKYDDKTLRMKKIE